MNPFIVTIRNGIVYSCEETTHEKSERDFLEAVSSNISNFQDYGADDIKAIIQQGYEKFGRGAVCLVHPEPSQKTSDELTPYERAELWSLIGLNVARLQDTTREQKKADLKDLIERLQAQASRL